VTGTFPARMSCTVFTACGRAYLTPDAIFALLASLGGRPGRSLVVACEPADVEAGMGLSDPVREALPHAVKTVQDILAGKVPVTGNGL